MGTGDGRWVREVVNVRRAMGWEATRRERESAERRKSIVVFGRLGFDGWGGGESFD